MTRPTCSAGTAPVMHALTTSHVHAAPWPDANTVLAILGKGSLCPLTHGQALCTPHAWSSPLHPSRMVNPSAPLMHGQPHAGL